MVIGSRLPQDIYKYWYVMQSKKYVILTTTHRQCMCDFQFCDFLNMQYCVVSDIEHSVISIYVIFFKITC